MKVLRIIGVLVALVLLFKAAEWWVTCCVPRTVDAGTRIRWRSPMKALTLTQPWASLIAVGAKRIETRSWYTQFRGPLAIHAAKGFTADDKEACYTPQFRAALAPVLSVHLPIESQLPFGKIVCVCELLGCFPTSKLIWDEANNDVQSDFWPRGFELIDANNEYMFGNYEPGRFAWLLGNIRPLPVPIETRGKQGLFEWTPPEHEFFKSPKRTPEANRG